MPLRIMELAVINYLRQVNIIRERHKKEQEEARKNGVKADISSGEYLSRFYKDDKITPVLCLVIYYGKEEWTGPTDLSDMFIQSEYTDLANAFPIKILDVRHMDEQDLEEYSDLLKPIPWIC